MNWIGHERQYDILLICIFSPCNENNKITHIHKLKGLRFCTS